MRRPLEIVFAFARIALSSFGGGNFWFRRVLVEDRGWISDAEFLETLAMAQLIPGPNACNLAVMLGHRFGGRLGAAAALAGLLAPPLAVVSALGVLYGRYGSLPVIEGALGGMAAVAAGLVLANGVALARALPRRAASWAFVALAFGGVGVLRLPLVAVMAGLAPFAIGLVWGEAAARREK